MSLLPPLKKKREPKPKKENDKYEFNIDYSFNLADDISDIINIVQDKKKGQQLVAKTYDIQINEQNKPFILRDVHILIQIQDPTIIRYRGFSYKDFKGSNKFTIFMDYIQNGSLFDILRNKKSRSKFNNTKKQIILAGIAHAMMVLHQNRIVHGNLKPENVLLDKFFNPYLSDIGFSKFFSPQNLLKKLMTNCFTVSYIAPEVFSNAHLTAKTDVYSFGIFAYEVITGKRAYGSLIKKKKVNPTSLIEKVQKGHRPTFKQQVKSGLKTVIEKCWSPNPKERPTFSELYQKLSLSEDNSLNSNEPVFSDKNDQISSEFGNLKYCLDEVNINELFQYIETISNVPKNEEQVRIDNAPTDQSKAILRLQNINSKLKKKNVKLNKINSEILKENGDMKNRISNLEKQLFSVATIDIFNSFPLQTQQKLISEIISKSSEKVNPFLTKLSNIILYLLQYSPNETNSYLGIVTSNPDELLASIESEHSIYLHSNLIEMLQFNKALKSVQFSDVLNDFNDVMIELKYPSRAFKRAYNVVLSLKNKNRNQIKICIFIDKIERTDKTFQNNKEIDSIKFGNEVISIQGDPFSEIGAFKGCSSLKTIKMSSSIKFIDSRSFKDCTSLFEIDIPSSVSSIGSYAFSGCSSLKHIVIPNSIKIINDNAFEFCTSLNSIEIPNSVFKICNNVFNGCSSLSKIDIPDSVTFIGESAFNNCTSLSEVKISSSLAFINHFTFSSCTSLLKIEIPPSVTEIGFRAFRNCSSLTDVKLPESLKSIGDDAFDCCSSLEKVMIPSSVTYKGGNPFPSNTQIMKI